jgi:hypothetical protein
VVPPIILVAHLQPQANFAPIVQNMVPNTPVTPQKIQILYPKKYLRHYFSLPYIKLPTNLISTQATIRSLALKIILCIPYPPNDIISISKVVSSFETPNGKKYINQKYDSLINNNV